MDNKIHCSVRGGQFVEPCDALRDACEYGNPRAARGVYAWQMYKNFQPSRTFFGVKSGKFIKNGMALNYCPFCGRDISAPFSGEEIQEPSHG